MKKIVIKNLFLVIIIGFMSGCQKEIYMDQGGSNVHKEIIEARRWYETNHQGNIFFKIKSRGGSSIEIKPDWEHAYVRSNKREKTVETELFMKGGINFALPENKQKFEETHDERYAWSHIRLVVKTNLGNGAKDAFLMSIIPSVEYLELTDFKAFDNNNYIVRDKQFTGRILYHNLEGEFVNGWVYQNGKITHSLKRVQQDETR
jgi:hypothetical protein